MKNPLPKGFNPFKAFAVRDAFPFSPWAKHEIFDDAFALVPVKLPPIPATWRPYKRDRQIAHYMAFINDVRRIDRRRVIDTALEQLFDAAKRMTGVISISAKDLLAMSTRDILARADIRAGIKTFVARLLNARMDSSPLPRILRVNYSQIVTTGTRTNGNALKDVHQLETRKITKFLTYDDIWNHGITWAIAHTSHEFGANVGNEIELLTDDTANPEER